MPKDRDKQNENPFAINLKWVGWCLGIIGAGVAILGVLVVNQWGDRVVNAMVVGGLVMFLGGFRVTFRSRW